MLWISLKEESPMPRLFAPRPQMSKDAFGGFGMGGGNNPPKKGNVSYSNINAGDVEAGFREADHIIEYDVNLPPFPGISQTR